MMNLKGLECLTLLIDQKSEVNAKDNQNNTPLHILIPFSFKYNHIGLRGAEELINARADLTAVNNEGKTPMDNKIVQILREQKPELFL
jgi:ankyrin repeat protein